MDYRRLLMFLMAFLIYNSRNFKWTIDNPPVLEDKRVSTIVEILNGL